MLPIPLPMKINSKYPNYQPPVIPKIPKLRLISLRKEIDYQTIDYQTIDSRQVYLKTQSSSLDTTVPVTINWGTRIS